MRWILLAAVTICLAGPAQAWELLFPERPADGAWMNTRVVDILVPRGGAMVRFANADWVAGCALVNSRGGTQATGYLQLSSNNASQQLPVVLFAKAHDLPIQVVIQPDPSDNHYCKVQLIRTCSDAAACATAPPFVR